MRRLKLLVCCALLIALLAGCGPGGGATPVPGAIILTVTGGDIEQTYTLEQLQALAAHDVESDDGAFVGVLLSDLLSEAGFDLDRITTVRAVAMDGFSSTYDATLFRRDDAVLAYARAGGDLDGDEQPLRMVIPGQEGRMQPHQITRLEIAVE